MITPSKLRDSRSYRRALMLSFVFALTAAAWTQTKPSDNPSTPAAAMPSTRNVGLLRDRPLFVEEHVQKVEANGQGVVPNQKQIEQNSPVLTPVGKCASGQTSCSGVCVNTSTNAQNCGSCGHACGTGTSCVNGACVQNLLANGTACQTSSQCSSGSCAQGVCCNISCGGCSGATLQACNFSGSVGTCATLQCPNGLSCGSNGACLTTCSNDANCVAPNICDTTHGGICVPRAPSGVPCTSPNQCQSGSCVNNVCQ